MKRNQKGFTIVEVLLIVLILAVLGFGGYYVYHTQHKTTTTSSSTTNSSSNNASTDTPTLAQAVVQTQKVYDTWTAQVTKGQVLQDKSQWAQSNALAAEDLQTINNYKSWFTTSFITKANNYETTNTLPPGGEFFACTSGIAYYNGDAKATGNQLNGETATVTVAYTDGSPGTGGKTTYSIPVTLKASNGAWAIDSIDLSSCGS